MDAAESIRFMDWLALGFFGFALVVLVYALSRGAMTRDQAIHSGLLILSGSLLASAGLFGNGTVTVVATILGLGVAGLTIVRQVRAIASRRSLQMQTSPPPPRPNTRT
jgi:hypothetical protein